MKRDRAFISYRRSDGAGHAGRLNADLTRRLGPHFFMDVSSIAPGDEFARVIDEELRSCGAVLAVIGAEWAQAFTLPRSGEDYVLLELRQALQHDGVFVIPVLIRGAALPSTAELPADIKALAGRQAVTLRDDRWDDDVANLARIVRRILGLSRVPRWVAPAVAVAVAIIGIATWRLIPRTPSAFNRAEAHEITIAAARKAVVSCGVAPGVEGECPVLLEFVPTGRVRNAYFDTGDCRYKGTGFGDCVLERLGRVDIPPFNNVPTAEVELGIRIDPKGAVDVFVDE